MQGTRPFFSSCPQQRVPKSVGPVVSGLIPCRHPERAAVADHRQTDAAQLQGHAWTPTADRPKENRLLMGNVIREVFNEVWKRQKGTEPPALDTDTLLLDIGLDSLGFAIVVTQLDEKLGFDPFSIAQDAYYPQTFGEFVAFYKKYAPEI
jgi:Phosphopantetheine attachment site